MLLYSKYITNINILYLKYALHRLDEVDAAIKDLQEEKPEEDASGRNPMGDSPMGDGPLRDSRPESEQETGSETNENPPQGKNTTNEYCI